VARGLAPTRVKAQALVLAGRVHCAGRRVDKPGTLLAEDAPLEVAGGPSRVGRGATKLEGGLDTLAVSPHGRDCLDVGASTGGFTQVLLERGAARVTCVDVGRGQLDWTLRNDPRVHVLEGVNARYLEPSALPFSPSLAVVDVSFISLRLVLPAIVACLEPGGEVVALVKPQFEVGRGRVGAGGIVRDPAQHRAVLEDLAAFCRERGWGIAGAARSPLRGAEGNVEFFLRVAPAGGGLDPDALARALAGALEAPSGGPA
jgi:23S rRNA (cytidine1920-2'-O)/16S rRNA (cytidine1409-2'-O)-methyltransferase